MDVALALKKLGYDPFIPLLFPFFEFACPNELTSQEMLNWELNFIDICDGLVRIRFKDEYGQEIPSSGADEEVDRAKSQNIPVYEFKSIEQMVEYLTKYPI